MPIRKSILVHLNAQHLLSLELEVSTAFGWQVDDVFDGESGTDKVLLFAVPSEPNTRYEQFLSFLRRKEKAGMIQAIAHPLPVKGSWWATVSSHDGHLLQVVGVVDSPQEATVIDLIALGEERHQRGEGECSGNY